MDTYYFHVYCGGALGETGESDGGTLFTCIKCDAVGRLLTPELIEDPNNEDPENIPTIIDFEGKQIVICALLLSASDSDKFVKEELPEMMFDHGFDREPDKLDKRLTKVAAIKLSEDEEQIN
jgi:hypothetical protein